MDAAKKWILLEMTAVPKEAASVVSLSRTELLPHVRFGFLELARVALTLQWSCPAEAPWAQPSKSPHPSFSGVESVPS